MITMQQYFNDAALGPVPFTDHRQEIYSQLAQPRDIQLARDLPADEAQRVIEAICVDIRLAQGARQIGVKKNLKWA